MSQETKICQKCRSKFTISSEDFQFYESMKVPAATFCPKCRMIRRLSWFNQRTLHKRKCDKTGKNMISVYAQDKPYTVYDVDVWWSDEWDPLEYGKEYDPNKPFFTQVNELLQQAPLMNLFGLFNTVTNSPYVNMVSHINNCYMVTYCDFSENITYGSFVNNSRDSVDNLMLDKCQLSYESVNCIGCYATMYSVDCKSCHNVMFSKNCTGCSDCYGCVNLRNKQYCIWNKQYTKEEYEKWIGNNRPTTYDEFQNERNRAKEYWQQFPVKYYHGTKNTNVSGDYIYNSKNAHYMYNVANIEDSKWCIYVTPEEGGLKDTYDFMSFGISSQRMYESLQSGNQASDLRFCWLVISNVYDCEYCISSYGIKNCFGCVSMKNNQYCILNKQYSEQEYYDLRSRIIEDMNNNPYIDSKGREYRYGEFFPEELSPFGYNETLAQEFFPLSKEEAESEGHAWYEKEDPQHTPTKTWEEIPEDISEVDDSILSEVLACEETGKPYRIVASELKFLRDMNLPLPRLHPDTRHEKRNQFRNPLKFWERTNEDGEEVITTYSPERPEKIYSEQGFNNLLN